MTLLDRKNGGDCAGGVVHGKEELYIRVPAKSSRFSSTNMAVVERGQRYKIVNAKSGTVLDLSSSNQEFGRHSSPSSSSTYASLTIRWPSSQRMELPRSRQPNRKPKVSLSLPITTLLMVYYLSSGKPLKSTASGISRTSQAASTLLPSPLSTRTASRSSPPIPASTGTSGPTRRTPTPSGTVIVEDVAICRRPHP